MRVMRYRLEAFAAGDAAIKYKDIRSKSQALRQRETIGIKAWVL